MSATPATSVEDITVAEDGRRPLLLTVNELLALAPPRWLLGTLLVANSLAVLFGPPGSGKSFLALDLALSFASGTAGVATPKEPGSVIYISAEGSAGMGNRVRAWQIAKETDAANIYFCPEPVQLMEADEVDNFLAEVQTTLPTSPKLVVVDTLARCMSGGDENSSRDMGRMINGADRIRRELGATVLLVHHTAKANRGTERGSSALRGAANTMLCLNETNRTLYLSCEKQKDAEPFGDLTLRLDPISLGSDGTTSCIVEHITSPTANSGLNKIETLVLAFLSEQGTAGTCPKQIIQATGIPESTYYRYQNKLGGRELIQKGSDGYVITDAGKEALSLSRDSHGTPTRVADPTESTTPTPTPIGVGGESAPREGETFP